MASAAQKFTARRQALAVRFVELPFAFIAGPEVDNLATLIRAGKLAQVIELLEHDIDVHEQCGNQLKAEVEIRFHEELAQLWEESGC
jgi:hypothetical protein